MIATIIRWSIILMLIILMWLGNNICLYILVTLLGIAMELNNTSLYIKRNNKLKEILKR